MGGDATSPTVTQPGTVLTIQKAGILGVPPTTMVVCPAKFSDGTLHPPTSICATMIKRSSRPLAVGEKVYVTKIDVNSKNDRVSLKIVECDSCNGTSPPTAYKSQVDFQFAKGLLATGDTSKIEDIIGTVLAAGDSAPAEPQAPPTAAQPEQPAPAAAPAAPAAPASIQLGQTIDQVVAALGQPQKMVDLGSKKIYVYKDLKVTFVDGKVSDVQ